MDLRLRHHRRFAAEALKMVCVSGSGPVHQLDCDRTLQLFVVGTVDSGHAATADLSLKAVSTADESAFERRHFWLDRQAARRPCSSPVMPRVGTLTMPASPVTSPMTRVPGWCGSRIATAASA